ncbi:MAG: xylosidase [Verrucomicrobia bacterium]|nr:MAG: xylosidase [Verrucomicrobiota bacterium]
MAGLEAESGVTRRDPSDVIRWRGRYYVWYTKTSHGFSGYNATIWYATSEDGRHWRERGEALGRGEAGSWDAYSVFTPNILKAAGRYWLFYTGVRPTPGNPEGRFENNSTTDVTAIGVAVADTPEGPFRRVHPGPVLTVAEDPEAFDSYRVDDACLVVLDGRYWLYYKGRSRRYGAQGPLHTRMGVAVAERPEGPFRKHPANPLTRGGHEVLVWPERGGVMTLLSAHGPDGRTLQFAPDGVHFRIVGRVGADYPKAPGGFRAGDFADVREQPGGLSWGVCMNPGNARRGVWPHLLRFDVEWRKRQ